MEKELGELSTAEWLIMKKIWDLKKTNAREICEELKPTKNWAYNTVRTMMERLREKGYLESKKIGNMYFYQPTVTRKQATLLVLRNFADKVFDGAIGPVVSYLIEQEKLSDKELKKIKGLLVKGDKKP